MQSSEIERASQRSSLLERYESFVTMFREAHSATEFLARSPRQEGELLSLQGIDSNLMGRYARELPELLEQLQDELEERPEGFNEEELAGMMQRLSDCEISLNGLEERCRAYSLYLADKENPLYLPSDETSKVYPLPETNSYSIGERTRPNFLSRLIRRLIPPGNFSII